MTKVILFEINEITWDLVDPWIAQGKLPNFKALKEAGSFGRSHSPDLGDGLDPWVTWTTFYTGKPQKEHNVFFLEQPQDEIKSKRVWEIAAQAGKSLGVFGSLNSQPIPSARGFFIPGTFSVKPDTHPKSLLPIQELNVKYTRNYGQGKKDDTLFSYAKQALQLKMLGLSSKTIFRITRQLAEEKLDSGLYWKRACLQPLINFDFFTKLYREHRPDFATFHTNHVAHFMHRHWREMNPAAFDLKPTEEARRQFQDVILYGHQIADELLGRMRELVDDDTVLIVASSMGQQPFNPPRLKEGKKLVHVKSLPALLSLLGVGETATAEHMMADQFNVYFKDEVARGVTADLMKRAYLGTPDRKLFTVIPVGKSITSTISRYDGVKESTPCVFPHASGDRVIEYGDLIRTTDGELKSGCHHEKGVFMFFGKDIPANRDIGDVSNIDFLPTMLDVLGVAAPADLKGVNVLAAAGVNAYRRKPMFTAELPAYRPLDALISEDVRRFDERRRAPDSTSDAGGALGESPQPTSVDLPS